MMDSSPLQRLPAEIRNTIWEYVVTSHKPIRISTTMKLPPITQVCEQISNETIGLYYSNNDFVFYLGLASFWSKDIDPQGKVLARGTLTLKLWLASIPAQHHQAIRELRLRGCPLVEPWRWEGIWRDRQDDMLNLVGMLEASGYQRSQICFDICFYRPTCCCDHNDHSDRDGTFLKKMEAVTSRVGLRSRFTYEPDRDTEARRKAEAS